MDLRTSTTTVQQSPVEEPVEQKEKQQLQSSGLFRFPPRSPARDCSDGCVYKNVHYSWKHTGWPSVQNFHEEQAFYLCLHPSQVSRPAGEAAFPHVCNPNETLWAFVEHVLFDDSVAGAAAAAQDGWKLVDLPLQSREREPSKRLLDKLKADFADSKGRVWATKVHQTLLVLGADGGLGIDSPLYKGYMRPREFPLHCGLFYCLVLKLAMAASLPMMDKTSRVQRACANAVRLRSLLRDFSPVWRQLSRALFLEGLIGRPSDDTHLTDRLQSMLVQLNLPSNYRRYVPEILILHGVLRGFFSERPEPLEKNMLEKKIGEIGDLRVEISSSTGISYKFQEFPNDEGCLTSSCATCIYTLMDALMLSSSSSMGRSKKEEVMIVEPGEFGTIDVS